MAAHRVTRFQGFGARLASWDLRWTGSLVERTSPGFCKTHMPTCCGGFKILRRLMTRRRCLTFASTNRMPETLLRSCTRLDEYLDSQPDEIARGLHAC